MTEDNVVGPWVEENPVECVLLVQRGSGPVPEVRRATTDDVAKAMGTTPAQVLRVQLDAEKDVTAQFCRERNEAREALAKSEAWVRRLSEDAEKAQAGARRASDRADQLYRAIGVPSFEPSDTPAKHAMWILDSTSTTATTIHEALAIVHRAAGCALGTPLSAHVAALRKQMANDQAVIGQLKQQLEDAKRSNENLSRAFKSEQQCNANLRRGISELNCIEAHLRDLMGAKAGEPTTEAVRRIVASKEGT